MRTTRLVGMIGGCLLVSAAAHAQKATEGNERLMPIEDIFSIQDRAEASAVLTDMFATGHVAIPGFGTFIPGFGTFIPGFGTFIPGFGTFGTKRGSMGSVTFSDAYSSDKDILEVALLGSDSCGDVLVEVESVCGQGQGEDVACIVRIPDDAPIGRFTPVMVMPGDNVNLEADQGSMVVIFEGIGTSPGPDNGIGTTPGTARLLEEEGIFYAKQSGSEPSSSSSSIFEAQPGKGLLDALDYASLDIRQSPAATVAYLASWFSSSEAPLHDAASDGHAFWATWDDATGHLDVKYGQCWVFAGMLNSTMKAIGIESRTVTNMDSAHESKPFDQKVQTRYEKKSVQYNETDWDFVNRSKTTQQSADSIWNFHVWTEVNAHTAEWTDHNTHDPGITILEMLAYGKPGNGDAPSAAKNSESMWNFHVWNQVTLQTDTGEILASDHGGESANFHVWVETFFESPAAPDGGWHAIEMTGISYPTLLRGVTEPVKSTGISYPTLLRSEVEAVDARATKSTEPAKKTKISMPTLLRTGISYPTLLRYSGISMPTLNSISMPTLAISMPTLCE
jgi:hypothetical protein